MKLRLIPRPITFACGHAIETRIPHSGRAPCPACQMQHKRTYERALHAARQASQEKAHG